MCGESTIRLSSKQQISINLHLQDQRLTSRTAGRRPRGSAQAETNVFTCSRRRDAARSSWGSRRSDTEAKAVRFVQRSKSRKVNPKAKPN